MGDAEIRSTDKHARCASPTIPLLAVRRGARARMGSELRYGGYCTIYTDRYDSPRARADVLRLRPTSRSLAPSFLWLDFYRSYGLRTFTNEPASSVSLPTYKRLSTTSIARPTPSSRKPRS
jgi:hypothetical protein